MRPILKTNYNPTKQCGSILLNLLNFKPSKILEILQFKSCILKIEDLKTNCIDSLTISNNKIIIIDQLRNVYAIEKGFYHFIDLLILNNKEIVLSIFESNDEKIRNIDLSKIDYFEKIIDYNLSYKIVDINKFENEVNILLVNINKVGFQLVIDKFKNQS